MPLPFVPGREGAGRVIAIGAGVDGVAVGDRVAWLQVPARTPRSSVGPADRLIPVPDGVSDEQAAALALQGLTAQCLATDAYRIERRRQRADPCRGRRRGAVAHPDREAQGRHG